MENPGSLAQLMIGAGIRVVLESHLMRVLAKDGASDALLLLGQSWVEEPLFPPKSLSTALAFEYDYTLKHQFDLRRDSKIPLGSLLDFTSPKPNWLAESRFKPQAFHNLNLKYLTLFDQLAFQEGPQARRAINEVRESLEAESKRSLWSLDPNRTGRILAAIGYAGYFSFESSCVNQVASRRCCAAVIAAKRWSLARGGERPATLTELVPDFLKSIPLDPLSGHPLRWDAGTVTAYTSGTDGVDDLPVLPEHRHFLARETGSAACLP